MMESAGTEYTGLLFNVFLLVLSSGIILLPFVRIKIKPVIAIITVAIVSLITGSLAIRGISSGGIEYIVNGGAFFGNIPFRIDALSAWFILIINFTSLTGVLYGAGYLKSVSADSARLSLHWILYLIFHSSMIMVTIVQHSIAFIIMWEIMSLSSFMLVLFDYTDQKVVKAAVNYLVQMHLSVVFLTVALIWVYVRSGTFDFRGISIFFDSNVNIWLFLIFFAGFGLKAGFLGFHTWLPQAHPAAPSHISGVMSGVIVKMGIYGIFRIITFLKCDFLILGEVLITISVMTGLFGIMNAAVHRDFKKMLAYCTIENIGIIGIGAGLGLIGIARQQNLMIFLGFGGALLHVLNHSLFKSLLFFSSGSVYSKTHTRNMDKLGGLIKKMPHTAILFLAGAVAIGGIPPLNGFISEFMIYSGILGGINSEGIARITLMILTFAGLSLIGGISILTFTKTFGTIFLGSPRYDHDHAPSEVSFLMLLPQYLILFCMLLISLFPVWFINITGIIIHNFTSHSIDPGIMGGYLRILKSISLASVIFILITGILFYFRKLVINRTGHSVEPTWGCGYIAPGNKMQYTGKSYSKSFGKLLTFLMIEKKGYAEISKSEVFPVVRKYRSFYLDAFEKKIIDPVTHQITRFINLFQFIQNGRIQAYIIYGIVFILAIFAGTILNFWH